MFPNLAPWGSAEWESSLSLCHVHLCGLVHPAAEPHPRAWAHCRAEAAVLQQEGEYAGPGSPRVGRLHLPNLGASDKPNPGPRRTASGCHSFPVRGPRGAQRGCVSPLPHVWPAGRASSPPLPASLCACSPAGPSSVFMPRLPRQIFILLLEVAVSFSWPLFIFYP